MAKSPVPKASVESLVVYVSYTLKAKYVYHEQKWWYVRDGVGYKGHTPEEAYSNYLSNKEK